MKKYIFGIFALMLVVPMAFFMTACGGKNNIPAEYSDPIPAALVGTWSDGEGLSYTFNENGKFTISQTGQSNKNGKFGIKDNEIYLSLAKTVFIESTFTISGNTLTFDTRELPSTMTKITS